jgi:hypothetical protein
MTSATTVEATTATVETATAADRASAMEAVAAMEFISTAVSAMTPIATAEPVMIPTTAMVPIAATVVAATIVAGAVEAMEPRAGPDKYSVHEVIRAPISIGRASVRSIWVVTVSAYRRRPNRYANRTNSDSHSYSYLRARNGAHREH